MKHPGDPSGKVSLKKRGPDLVARLANHAGLSAEALEPATDAAWDRLERMLGCQFPASHRRLLKTFGTGIFGGRLLLLNPSAELDWRSEFSARWVHGVASMLRGAFPKQNFQVEEGGLLPFGMTSDSSYLCFDRAGAPATWGVRICSLRDHWTQRTSLTSVELLSHLAQGDGRLKSELRLRLWRPGEPTFQSASYLRFG